jgi:hypothetical protein
VSLDVEYSRLIDAAPPEVFDAFTDPDRHRHLFEVIERPRRIVLASTETRLDGSSFHTRLEFTFEDPDGKTS